MPPARWIVLVSGAVALASLALGACDALGPKRSEGERLWRARCAECHGLDGRGNTPQYMGNDKADLTTDRGSGFDPEAWEVAIRKGVFGSMPANPDLDRQQVKALVDYIRQLRHEGGRTGGG